MRRDNLEESFTINVLGVHWVTREFLPLLQKGTLKKVANMQDHPPLVKLFPVLTKSQFNHPRLYLASSCRRFPPRPRLQDLESGPERPHRPVRSRLRKGRLYIHRALSRRIYPFLPSPTPLPGKLQFLTLLFSG